MISTHKTYDKKPIAYEVLENGYMIYLDGRPWVDQREPYSKPMDASKSYEENCLLQIEDITAEPKEDDIDTMLAELETEVGINE